VARRQATFRDVIVFSYRRADSAGLVRALHERLVHRLGTDRLFLDVDTIAAGADFRAVLRDAVRRAEALVVVIGRHWLETEEGVRRLDDPEDVVRLEIATALDAGVTIVPVLVDGARMPARRDLPEPVRALADRNAVEITNVRFDADAQRLLAVLAPEPPFPITAAALVVAGVIAVVVYAFRAASWSWFAWGLGALAAIPAISLLPLLRRRLPAGGGSRHLATGLSVAAFALLFASGMIVRAQQAATPFALAVRVISTANDTASNRGEILLEYEGDRLRSPVGPDGVAHFARVPGSARGRDVHVIPDVTGYRADTTIARVGPGVEVRIGLVAIPVATMVRGRVVDRGGRPMAGVELEFGDGDARVVSATDGSFSLTVPWKPGESVVLRAIREGVVGYEQRVTIPSSLPLEVPFATDGG
jgi:hypothetical protein